MILDRIWASAPEARLLPVEKLHGPTVGVAAIMTFAMVVVAAAGLALANAASVVASGAENGYVIQLPAAAAADLPKAIGAAKAVSGVRNVTAVPEQEMRETLEGWLGEAASSRDLPVPSLVTVELAPGADSAALSRSVRKAVPQATVIAQSAELKPLLGTIRALQWLALALVLLLGGATAAAIVLAARGALDTHRPTVEIMHGIGATDAQVTKLFVRKIAVDSAAGAVAGLLAAGVALLVLGGGISTLAGEFAATTPLRRLDMLLLALIPLAAVAISVSVAHWTLLKALRSTL